MHFDVFVQLLTMTEGGDEEFYRTFQDIGYNKALELDEAATFTLTLTTSTKPSAITSFTTHAHDADVADQLWTRHLTANAIHEPIEGTASLEILKDCDDARATIAVHNKVP